MIEEKDSEWEDAPQSSNSGVATASENDGDWEDIQTSIPAPKEREPNVLEKTFDIPSAAIRSALQGKGYIQGAMDYKNVPKFQDIALQKVNEAITKTPIAKLDVNTQTAIRSAIGMPISAAGLAADIATNPADMILALAGKAPGAARVGEIISESLPGRIIRNALTSEIHSPMKLGGIKSLEQLSMDMSRSLKSLYGQFNSAYEGMFKTIGNKFLPKESTKAIETAIDGSIRKISPDSPIFNYLSKVKERLSGITGPELHALKQELFYRGKPVKGTMGYEMGEVYDSMSDALSHPKVYGQAYKDLSRSYSSFKQNIANYIEDNIYDKYGKVAPSNNIVGTKPADRQVEKAIKRLGSKVGRDFVTPMKQLKTGRNVVKTIERYGPAAVMGAGSIGAAYGIGRAITASQS